MISRIHASAVVKMLFDLPAEIYVDAKESAILERLSEAQVDAQAPELRTFLTLRPTSQRAAEAQLNWIDAQKYAVRVVQTDPTA